MFTCLLAAQHRYVNQTILTIIKSKNIVKDNQPRRLNLIYDLQLQISDNVFKIDSNSSCIVFVQYITDNF